MTTSEVIRLVCKGVGYSISPAECGWSAEITFPDGERVPLRGKEAQGTHERMDLLACLQGLRYLHNRGLDTASPIAVYSNCQTLVMGMVVWKAQWIPRGWLKRNGEPVHNRDLWEQLDAFERSSTLLFPDVNQWWSSFKSVRERARLEAYLEHLQHMGLVDNDWF